MPAETKALVRRQMIDRRRHVPEHVRRAWSTDICRRVCESAAFVRAGRVVSYVPMGAEVDPSAATEVALRSGRAVYLPVGERDPALAAWPGAREPRVEDVQDAMLVLVPGVAFDAAGRRLGRGAGWYDRLLGRLPTAVRCGLAFSMQLLPTVPYDSWDQPMDVVVTELGLHSHTRFPLPEGTA